MIATLFWFNTFSVTAKQWSLIKIQKHSLWLFNVNKNTRSARLYKSGVLQISILWNSEIKLIEKNGILTIWVPYNISDKSAILKISTPKINYSFPIYIDIKSKNSDTDYDIFSAMFQSSLQKKSLSCESSATSDIISWFENKHTSEDTIIELLPKDQYFDALPTELNNGSLLWWNPNKWFVGYIDNNDDLKASQSLLTWYWVYEEPIQNAYKKLWYKAVIINKWLYNKSFWPKQHLSLLLERLQKLNMVQLWWDWCTREQYEDWIIETKHQLTQEQANKKISAKNQCWNVDKDRSLSWKYKDSSWNLINHTGLNGQHAFVLLWWKWSIKNPTHIRVWDTDTGYHEYQTQEWMRKWKAMDYRSVVVSK